MQTTNHRNQVRQVVPMFDKETGKPLEDKVIFHPKKTHAPQFGNMKASWNFANTIPKPKSKRQIELKKKMLEKLS